MDWHDTDAWRGQQRPRHRTFLKNKPTAAAFTSMSGGTGGSTGIDIR
jgi:hypothetical protein